MHFSGFFAKKNTLFFRENRFTISKKKQDLKDSAIKERIVTSAISHMIVAGGRKVKELLVIGNSDDPCMPCGLCRQRLLEFIDDTASVTVHLAHPERGIVKTLTFADLYPHVFGAEQLHS